jgi:hypothetical protein
MSELHNLPNQFPDGTKFVIEGRGGRVLSRYLEFPDGRHVDLAVDGVGTQRHVRARRRRKIGSRGAGK